jgi:alpha-glucosidase
MRNATKGNAKPSNSFPVSQGTRCHQMAMYVVYEAPLQMMADNPTIYMKEQECAGFIATIPTVFDETIALDGKLGEYALIARRNNGSWYVGGMSNWDAREISLDLSFLGEGQFRATIFKDGPNADKDATDYMKESIPVSSKDRITISMKSGGGWVAIISPE